MTNGNNRRVKLIPNVQTFPELSSIFQSLSESLPQDFPVENLAFRFRRIAESKKESKNNNMDPLCTLVVTHLPRPRSG